MGEDMKPKYTTADYFALMAIGFTAAAIIWAALLCIEGP